MRGLLTILFVVIVNFIYAQTTWDKKQDASIKDIYKSRDTLNAQAKRLFAADISLGNQLIAAQKQIKAQNDSSIKAQKQIKALQLQNDSLISLINKYTRSLDSSQFSSSPLNVIYIRRLNELLTRMTAIDGKP